MTEQTIAWYPLESNPEVLTKFAQDLGVSKQIYFADVLGFDQELLDLVPKPILALLLLFPITPQYKSAVKDQLIAAKGEQPKAVYFMRQKIKNACGAVAVLHALLNNTENIILEKDSELEGFLQRSRDLTPEERGSLLSQQRAVAEYAKEVAFEGQTKTPAAEADVMLHFITFVNRDGVLYELDGDKPVPLSHGNSEDILKDTVRVVQDNFMKLDPDNLNFSLIALVKNTSD